MVDRLDMFVFTFTYDDGSTELFEGNAFVFSVGMVAVVGRHGSCMARRITDVVRIDRADNPQYTDAVAGRLLAQI